VREAGTGNREPKGGNGEWGMGNGNWQCEGRRWPHCFAPRMLVLPGRTCRSVARNPGRIAGRTAFDRRTAIVAPGLMYIDNFHQDLSCCRHYAV
jgi:hypothetical protein